MSLGLKLLDKVSQLKIKRHGENSLIFDPVRRKYISFKPEEMVRQLLILFLLEDQSISRARIAVERKITLSNDLEKRFDILVFDKNGEPWMIIECKSADVALSQKVIDQAGAYNGLIRAPFLCVSNGQQTKVFALDFEKRSFQALKHFPQLV